MTAHIVLLAYISLCGAFIYGRGSSDKKNRVFLLLSLLGIFLIEALRKYTVGLDTYEYYTTFWRIKNETYGKVVGSWEPLYFYMNKLVGQFTDNPQWIIAISSAIIMAGLGIFIYENADKRQALFWHIFIFITFRQYFNTMNLLRQCIAMAFGCNVYTVLRKDRSIKGIIKAALLVLTASLFHTSGLISILFFVPFYFKMDRRKLLYGLGGMVLLYYLYPYMLRLFLSLFPRYNRYDFSVVTASNSYLLFGAVNLLLALMCIVYVDPRNPENDECYRLLFFVLLSTVTIVLQRRNQLMTRLGYYFEWFIILFIPEVVRRWRSSVELRVMFKFFLFTAGWLFFIYSMNVGFIGRGSVPYLFFWQ